jgi:hypothetical protein
MKLFEGRMSGEFAWEDEVCYEEEFGEYILEEDVRDYYMDDESCDIDIYYEVDAQD